MHVNKTVELVNEWASYEAKYPGGDVADFAAITWLIKMGRRRRERW